MRKIAFSFLICFFFLKGFGQQTSVIIKGGVGINKFSEYPGLVTVVGEDNFKAGLYGGVELEIALNKQKKWFFQPEILYVQRKTELHSTTEFYGLRNTKIQENYKFNFIEIPVLLKFKKHFRNWSFFCEAGPALGIGVNGKHNFSWEASEPVNPSLEASLTALSNSSDIYFASDERNGNKYTRIRNRYEVAIQAGGGMGYKLPNQMEVFFNIRYTHALSNLEFDDYNHYGYSDHARYGFLTQNRALTTNIGLLIPLKK